MKKINVRKLAAFTLALCMCAAMAGCGSSGETEEKQIEDKLESITEEELEEGAQKLEEAEGITTTASAAEEAPAVETVEVAEVVEEPEETDPAFEYLDLLGEEWEAQGYSGSISLYSLNDNKPRKNYIEDGDNIVFVYPREYDPAVDTDLYLPGDYVKEIRSYAEEHGEDPDEAIARSISEQKVIEVCVYNTSTKELKKPVILSHDAFMSAIDIRYSKGQFLIDYHDSFLHLGLHEAVWVDMDGNITEQSLYKDTVNDLDNFYYVSSYLSDGTVLLRLIDNDDNTKTNGLFLMNSSGEVTELPAPQKANAHGLTQDVEWDGTNAVYYDGRIYAPALSIYYDTSSGQWATVSEKDYTEDLFIAVGKYLVSTNYMLDMETNEYILDDDNIDLRVTEGTGTVFSTYFGGGFLQKKEISKADNTYTICAVKKPSDGVSREQTEALAEGIEFNDAFDVELVSDKHWMMHDDYGYFLHTFGEDGEEVVLAF